LGPELLEKVSPILCRKRFDQVLLGRGQNAGEPDDEKIADQVRVHVLWPAAHVFLVKAADACTNGRFDASPAAFFSMVHSSMMNTSASSSLRWA
jgi:hypothetical protein